MLRRPRRDADGSLRCWRHQNDEEKIGKEQKTETNIQVQSADFDRDALLIGRRRNFSLTHTHIYLDVGAGAREAIKSADYSSATPASFIYIPTP